MGVLSTILAIVIVIVVVIVIVFIILILIPPGTQDSGGIGGLPPVIQGDIGDSCITSDNCTGSLVCENGFCRTTINGACTFNSDCQSSQRCVNGQCATPVDFGDACVSDLECPIGGICENNVCKKGLYLFCTPDAFTQECADPYLCDYFSLIEPTRCRKPGGSVCTINEDCFSRECVNGICNSGIGESCSSTQCANNLSCDSNICKGFFGAICLSNDECLSNNCSPSNFCSL